MTDFMNLETNIVDQSHQITTTGNSPTNPGSEIDKTGAEAASQAVGTEEQGQAMGTESDDQAVGTESASQAVSTTAASHAAGKAMSRESVSQQWVLREPARQQVRQYGYKVVRVKMTT